MSGIHGAEKTEYYRSNDPLENLKFFLSIREVNRRKDFNSAIEAEDEKTPFFHFENSISWQQKFFSPSEIADYLFHQHNSQHHSMRHGTPSQIETRSLLARMEASGANIRALLTPVMFFTYIDRDRVHIQQEFSTAVGNHASLTSRRRFSDNSYKVMHFCLATDVQVDKLLSERYGEYKHFYHEHILCSIKIFQDGLIEVSPAISKLVVEPINELPPDLTAEYHATLNPSSTSSVQALSLFFSDLSVESALRKGFRLSTVRLRSQRGSDFEYAIYNARDVLIPQQLEDLLTKQELVDSIRSSEIRGNASLSSSAQWKQDPSSFDFVYGLQTEIVSAGGFEEGNKIGISYQLYYPTPHWKLRAGDVTDGQNNVPISGSVNNANSTPHSAPVFNELDQLGMLQGSTQVAHYSRKYSRINRFFSLRNNHCRLGSVAVGCLFWIIAVLSVVEGVENAIWILPCLGIFFLGRSLTFSLNTVSWQSEIADDKMQKSITPQQDRSRRLNLVSDNYNFDLVFNYLVNYNFDVKDIKFEHFQLFHPTTQYPIVFLQIYSYSSPSWLFNRRRTLLGYANFQLPLTAGEFTATVQAWKPRGSIRHMLHEFFIGDAISLKDAAFPRDLDTLTKSLNRFGILTETMGNVYLRGKVIITDARSIERKMKSQEALLRPMARTGKAGPTMRTSTKMQERLTNFKMKKSVEDIMKSFRDNRSGTNKPGNDGEKLTASAILSRLRGERESKSESTNPPAGRPSIKSILESINATAKTSKSAVTNMRAGEANEDRDDDDEEHQPLLIRRETNNATTRGRYTRSEPQEEQDDEETAPLLK